MPPDCSILTTCSLFDELILLRRYWPYHAGETLSWWARIPLERELPCARLAKDTVGVSSTVEVALGV